MRIGDIGLSHRIVMAPLTRSRSSAEHVPLVPMMANYYSERASSIPGGLIITEATVISPRADGWQNTPGIWAAAQVEAWSQVTGAVHDAGGYIFCQLWAMGRAADPALLKSETGGPYQLVSSSTVAMPGEGAEFTPRSLTIDEIQEYVADYAQAASNAIRAGFDGVEIHGANGYLVDQFTQDTCNRREDCYGGSVENRSRFALEVVQAVVDAVGAQRVAIRLSPWSTFQGMRMEDGAVVEQFSFLIRGLAKLNLAFLELVEARIGGDTDVATAKDSLRFALDAWSESSRAPVLVAGGYTGETAQAAVDQNALYRERDVGVVFGRYFISNPDLPFRIQKGLPLNKYDRTTFYTPMSERGYLDYPFSREYLESKQIPKSLTKACGDVIQP